MSFERLICMTFISKNKTYMTTSDLAENLNCTIRHATRQVPEIFPGSVIKKIKKTGSKKPVIAIEKNDYIFYLNNYLNEVALNTDLKHSAEDLKKQFSTDELAEQLAIALDKIEQIYAMNQVTPKTLEGFKATKKDHI